MAPSDTGKLTQSALKKTCQATELSAAHLYYSIQKSEVIKPVRAMTWWEPELYKHPWGMRASFGRFCSLQSACLSNQGSSWTSKQLNQPMPIESQCKGLTKSNRNKPPFSRNSHPKISISPELYERSSWPRKRTKCQPLIHLSPAFPHIPYKTMATEGIFWPTQKFS